MNGDAGPCSARKRLRMLNLIRRPYAGQMGMIEKACLVSARFKFTERMMLFANAELYLLLYAKVNEATQFIESAYCC